MTSHPSSRRRSLWWWVLFAVGVALVLFGMVAWLGGQIAPDGESYLRDPDAIILAIIGGLVSFGSLLAPKLQKIETQTSATRNHVVNSHERNLRDDIDELLAHSRHHSAKFQRIEDVLANQGKDIFGIREEIGQLRRTEREQWEAIEKTGAKRRREQE